MKTPCLYLKHLYAKRQIIIAACACFMTLACAGISTPEGKSEPKRFVGASIESVQDVGLDVMQNGGNAADAAAAMLMAQAVYLPGRAGLGAGGVCQVYSPKEMRVRTLDFLPSSLASGVGVPALSRGVFTIQNTYGVMRWSDVLAPAITLAENGVTVSKQLSRDLGRNTFSRFSDVKEGELMKQAALAKTLKQLATSGSGVLYRGDMAEKIIKNGKKELDASKLASFKAVWSDSIEITSDRGKTFFPNLAVFGPSAYPIWGEMVDLDDDVKYKKAKAELKTLDDRAVYVGETLYGASVMAVDETGLTVVCAVSQGNLFGANIDIPSLGLSLPDVIDETKMSASVINVIQTDAGAKDVTYVLSAIGDYSIADGMIVMEEDILNLRTFKQSMSIAKRQLPADRKEVLEAAPVLSCRDGVIDKNGTCAFDASVIKVLNVESGAAK